LKDYEKLNLQIEEYQAKVKSAIIDKNEKNKTLKDNKSPAGVI
jgi:hypothetical protein